MTSFGRVWSGLVLAAGLLAASLLMAAPVQAGPAEVAFLQSYIGSWKGVGELQGGAETESFICQVNVTKGKKTKINYAGRCAVAGLNLSVAGTIAYVDAAGHYEAAMTSNATFAGTAVGQKQGDAVVFDLKERDTDQQGNDMTITSQVSLRGNQIGLTFTVTLNSTGQQSNATVNFTRL